MSEAGVRLAEGGSRCAQHRVDEGRAIGNELTQALVDDLLGRALLEVDEPGVVRVDRQHADLVGGAECADGSRRRVASDGRLGHAASDAITASEPVVPFLVTVAGVHRAAGVDGQHLGHALAAKRIGDLRDHRQEFLEVTVAVAAECIGMGATDHHHAAPEIPHCGSQILHLSVGEVAAIDVDQHDRGVLGEPIDGGDGAGADSVVADVAGIEGSDEAVARSRPPVDHEDSGGPLDRHGSEAEVVGGNRIAECIHLDLITHDAEIARRVDKGDRGGAGIEGQRLYPHDGVASSEGDLGVHSNG